MYEESLEAIVDGIWKETRGFYEDIDKLNDELTKLKKDIEDIRCELETYKSDHNNEFQSDNNDKINEDNSETEVYRSRLSSVLDLLHQAMNIGKGYYG